MQIHPFKGSLAVGPKRQKQHIFVDYSELCSYWLFNKNIQNLIIKAISMIFPISLILQTRQTEWRTAFVANGRGPRLSPKDASIRILKIHVFWCLEFSFFSETLWQMRYSGVLSIPRVFCVIRATHSDPGRSLVLIARCATLRTNSGSKHSNVVA